MDPQEEGNKSRRQFNLDYPENHHGNRRNYKDFDVESHQWSERETAACYQSWSSSDRAVTIVPHCTIRRGGTP